MSVERLERQKMKMIGISDFYRGMNIFLTGATGFIGKVLLEKILRSCPDVGNIYVLIRQKRGKIPNERMERILNLQLFDRVRRDRPENLKKIVPLSGDCAELGLGLSASDRQLLEETVSIVFHAAANVKFDDPLKYIALLNVRGTRELMMIARNMKNLKVLVHVSTTFCNCDRTEVQEMIYPPHDNWRDIVSLAEHVDEHTLDILTPKFLRKLPNTYTFTKSLSEHVVKDLGENLPVVIFRPSVVISSLSEPFPGWLDSCNGPVGLMYGVGKGIIRIVYGDPNARTDYIPIDVCVQFMLIASWFKAVSGNTTEPSVYNASANKLTLPAGQVMSLGIKVAEDIPMNDILWYPNSCITTSLVWYYLNVIFFHLIPALVIDGFLKLCRRKPLMLRLHGHIHRWNMLVSFFSLNSWKFRNDKLLWLRTQVLPCDKKDFNLDNLEDINYAHFYKDAIMGGKKYILKEQTDTWPHAKKCYKRMYWLDKSVRVIVLTLFLWFEYRSAFLQYTLHGIFTSLFS